MHQAETEAAVAAEAPLFSFQVITDTHVTEDAGHTHNGNFDGALQQIKELAPHSKGIMHVGDVTDHGFPGEYAEFQRIWNKHRSELPEMIMTMGNHDVGLGVWEDRIGRFLSNTDTAAPYHAHWIEGHLFIFLGTERNLKIYCSLSEEQLNWLKSRLEEEAASGRPIFIFLHQPLKNTVAGSYEEQQWHGVEEDDELRAVLEGYLQAILFTGHTHWELEAGHTFFDGGGKLPAMVNAVSTAYLWTDEDQHKDGSQGLFVDVYQDRVVVRGRDFDQAVWVESAHYEIPYPGR
ncbi:metallophosphoesterase [Paenibacillus paeoniae]|uniref:Metallophosphoesterase n=2 Tax=Paenibacillus paeoniae TaxID=2292705 RepID=A0A371PEY5_9BACL|nr:metallophosphoesterase [Paenibacillus paeoniae]REK74472.1 metallophosphoesterase [Paenibacillus paeoniae]